MLLAPRTWYLQSTQPHTQAPTTDHIYILVLWFDVKAHSSIGHTQHQAATFSHKVASTTFKTVQAPFGETFLHKVPDSGLAYPTITFLADFAREKVPIMLLTVTQSMCWWLKVIAFGILILDFEVPHAYTPGQILAWKVTLAALVMASSVSIIYRFYFCFTGAGQKLLFWTTRSTGLLALVGSTCFLVHDLLEQTPTRTGLVAFYLSVSVVESSLDAIWTLRNWHNQELPRTYDPICHGAIGDQSHPAGNQAMVGEVAVFYNQLLQEADPPEGERLRRVQDRQNWWRVTEVSNQLFNAAGPTKRLND